jgi:hypothetical protein
MRCTDLERVGELSEQAFAFGLKSPHDFNQLAVLKRNGRVIS